jgi:signal transduction histidine kinase/CheY-like chemotaxis protein/HPt (histidine-containing phosphotransfer) domain-containing protein
LLAPVLSAMGAAVFVSQGGELSLLGSPPLWLQQLVPEILTRTATSLADRFPLLEVFLPEAEITWAEDAGNLVCSDLWTEDQPDGTPIHLQACAVGASGQRFLILQRSDALYNEHQLVLQYAHDTALQNDTIARLSREALAATEAKSQFLAMMSHEIRTPMNSILGMADLLAETPLRDDQRKYVEVFQRAGSSLLNLINDILDLSKVEAGQMTLEAIDFDLADVVERGAELIRMKAAAKGLSVAVEIATDVPRFVQGDPTRLRQIIINLLGNSLKFTDTGGLTVRVTLNPESTEPNALKFTVADTGIGIPPEKLDSVFQSFTQVDASTTRKYGGTGLGLTITKRLVEAMKGRIWVESQLGAGSQFHFTAQFGAALTQPSAAPEPVSEAVLAAAPSLRILVADDSEDNRFLIRAYLKDLPWSLDFAENGALALEMLKNATYDLALVDVHMPEMDGYTAVTRYREHERTLGSRRLPILALTADAFREAVEKSLSAGFDAHLAKPIRKPTLMEAIQRHSRRSSASAETAMATEPPRAKAAAAAEPANIVVAAASDDDIMPELAAQFVSNIRRNPVAIASALARSDFDVIRSLGHNMKGTGTSYGFPAITDVGARLEQAAKDHSVEAIQAALQELSGCLRTIEQRSD